MDVSGGRSAKPALVLHIGPPQTGAFAIQRMMLDAGPFFASQGIWYAGAMYGDHNILASALRDRACQQDGPACMESEEILARFASEIAVLPAHVRTVVISGEEFSFDLASANEVAALADILRPHFGAVEIIVYMRRQDEYYAELHALELRQGLFNRPLPFHEIMRSDVYCEYDVLLKRWESAFEGAVVRPRIFEPAGNKPFDACDDFCAALGVVLPAGAKAKAGPAAMNAMGQKILLRMRQTMGEDLTGDGHLHWPVWTAILAAIDKILPGKGWRMPVRESSKFMQKYRAGNEAVRKRFFPERTQLFRGTVPGVDDTKTSDEKSLLIAACAVIRELGEQVNEERFKQATLLVQVGSRYGDRALLNKGMQRQTSVKPADISANMDFARDQIKAGRLSEAAMALSRVLRTDPQHQEARTLLDQLKV